MSLMDTGAANQIYRTLASIGTKGIKLWAKLKASPWADDLIELSTELIENSLDGNLTVAEIFEAIVTVGAGKYLDDMLDVAKGAAKATVPQLNITAKKLQKKFKHAIDFGIEGNFNKTSAQLFENAIKNHIDEATDIFKSTYRGQDVYVYMKDGLGVYSDMVGEFISGWKFTNEQIQFHLQTGIRIK